MSDDTAEAQTRPVTFVDFADGGPHHMLFETAWGAVGRQLCDAMLRALARGAAPDELMIIIWDGLGCEPARRVEMAAIRAGNPAWNVDIGGGCRIFVAIVPRGLFASVMTDDERDRAETHGSWADSKARITESGEEQPSAGKGEPAEAQPAWIPIIMVRDHELALKTWQAEELVTRAETLRICGMAPPMVGQA